MLKKALPTNQQDAQIAEKLRKPIPIPTGIVEMGIHLVLVVEGQAQAAGNKRVNPSFFYLYLFFPLPFKYLSNTIYSLYIPKYHLLNIIYKYWKHINNKWVHLQCYTYKMKICDNVRNIHLNTRESSHFVIILLNRLKWNYAFSHTFDTIISTYNTSYEGIRRYK